MINDQEPFMTADENAYFQELWTRERGAPVPTFLVATCAGEPPKPNECHRNAEIFAFENEGFVRVAGWLNETNASRLAAHSLVENGEGELFEITCEHSFRFIRHVGELSVFEALRKKFPGLPYRFAG